ncbi:hypothetical protein NM947_01520 [Pasteurella multocida]|nr:hypothetical protein [Pasteurella multocida]MDA5609874.1 hypothetical protein [Pasteurella multocida]MDA5612226.1 hypothetical protein [Pasteurella multocida]
MDTSIGPTNLQHCQLTYLHQLAKGMTVYQQGEVAQEFYFVKEGLVGLSNRAVKPRPLGRGYKV